MSLLQQLTEKRHKLKTTSTIVTLPTGERFLENRTSTTPIVKLEKQSFGFVEDTKPDQVPAEIIADFLYLGSQDAFSIENCKTYKFTHILSVGVNLEMSAEYGILVEHLFLPLLDLPKTKFSDNNALNEALKFIEKANQTPSGRVLVHCNAGVSRSASIVIAYLMKNSNLSFDDAYKFVKSKRPCIQPNVGFIRQLRELLFNN